MAACGAGLSTESPACGCGVLHLPTPPAAQYGVTQRKVHQPRQMMFPGSPTFQEYVNRSDGREGDGEFLPLEFLRDEYISGYGTDYRGVWL